MKQADDFNRRVESLERRILAHFLYKGIVVRYDAYALRVGVRVSDDYWTNWVAFRVDDPAKAEDYAIEFIDRNEWHAYYSGPGRPFMRHPRYQVVGNHVLVTQSGGLDI